MTPILQIERDLDWRESELAILKILLINGDLSDRDKLVLFRAAWALLYAHYEGFCKFALSVFYDAVKATGKRNSDLPVEMQAFALEKNIKTLKNLSTSSFLQKIALFEADCLMKSPDFPDVDTESNLWPSVLQKLLTCASVEVKTLGNFNQTIKTLVSRRNKIAHGERDIIPEFSYYVKFEDAVRNIMYDLAISIHERLEEIYEDGG